MRAFALIKDGIVVNCVAMPDEFFEELLNKVSTEEWEEAVEYDPTIPGPKLGDQFDSATQQFTTPEVAVEGETIAPSQSFFASILNFFRRS